MNICEDEAWMQVALDAASRGALVDEVPVGAAVVVEGRLVAAAHNVRELERDPTGHAEIVALRRAAAVLGRWRLEDATLYVTLEPCAMCAGAIVNARIRRLVFGAADARAGAVRTLYSIADDPRLNHRVEIAAGVRAERCAALLTDYFRAKRAPPAAERYLIRAATASDLRDIGRMHASAVRASCASRVDEDGLRALIARARAVDWSRIFAGPENAVFIAAHARSGTIVGFVAMTSDGVDRAELLGIKVLREIERRGVGRRLVTAMLPWLCARGATAMTAWLCDTDHATRRFFSGIGATQTGVRDTVIGDTRMREISIALSLSSLRPVSPL